jgi:hypothetical protein
MWISRSDHHRLLFQRTFRFLFDFGMKNLLVYLFGRLINCIYFASGFNTSYVAEWRGGGPHDLLRGFDSFRNCI